MTDSTTWYRPEFPSDSTAHNCYCHQQAYGRTSYWDGHRFTFKYQCRKHLPADSAVAEQAAR